jgi:hypothetical protein
MWNVSVRGGMPTEFWWRNVQERDNLQVLGVNGRIMLKLILHNYDGSALTVLTWLRVGTDCCEDGNEPSGSIKFKEFFCPDEIILALQEGINI